MPPKHRRGHSAIVNTSVLTPNQPRFQANVTDYDPVAQSDEEPAEKPAPTPARIDFDEALHEQGYCVRCAARGRFTQRRLPWMFACAVLGAACIWLILTRPAGDGLAAAPELSVPPITPAKPETPQAPQTPAGGSAAELGTYETGFNNEFAPMRSLISIEQTQFAGSPQWGADNKGIVPTPEGKPVYVGTPSPELDATWNALVKDSFFLLSDDEARDAWGPDYEKWWVDERGGYLAGVEALHALNCLNHLRQSLDPEYYPHQTLGGTEWHHDYCIDHLRQMVMCHGDLTPVPSRYVPQIRQFYVNTDQAHTCRNFDAIRSYVTRRVSGDLAVPARNQKEHGS